MKITKRELSEALERIRGVPVLVVGDLILDRYVWGNVSRISPEAPVPVVEVVRTEDRLGGAANVARNLRSLDARVTMCGFIGDDDEGRRVVAQFDKDGVSKEGVIIDRERPTSLKTRVIGQRQQIVRIDRENVEPRSVAMQEAFAALVGTHIEASRAVILSDYGKNAVSEALIRRFEEARTGGRISLKDRPLVVDPHPTNYAIYAGMSVAKPNRREAEVASGIKIVDTASAIAAANVLLSLWQAEMMLITLGEGGMVMTFADKSEPIILATQARQVFDVSGAGDTVTAVFTAAVAAGATPRVAGELANISAGIVVSEVGTVAVNIDKLRAEIEAIPA